MKSNIFINTAITLLYIITYILATLFISSVITIIGQCEYYTLTFSSKTFFIFKTLLLPILGYVFVKILKMNNIGLVVFCIILPYFSFIFNVHMSKNILEKILNTGTSQVLLAELVDKHTGRSTRTVTYRLFSKKNTFMQGDVNLGEFKKLKIGDTILVKQKQNCIYIKRIYNLTPNQKELEYCQEGCFLINDSLFTKDKKKIISKTTQYKNSKPTKLGFLFIAIGFLITGILIYVEVKYRHFV